MIIEDTGNEAILFETLFNTQLERLENWIQKYAGKNTKKNLHEMFQTKDYQKIEKIGSKIESKWKINHLKKRIIQTIQKKWNHLKYSFTKKKKRPYLLPAANSYPKKENVFIQKLKVETKTRQEIAAEFPNRVIKKEKSHLR